MQVKHATMYTRLASSLSHWPFTVLSVMRTTQNLIALMRTWLFSLASCSEWSVSHAEDVTQHLMPTNAHMASCVFNTKTKSCTDHMRLLDTLHDAYAHLLSSNSFAKAGKLIASLDWYWQGWQAHCQYLFLVHRSNKIIHTISYETCGDPSPSCFTNTLLETRIHVHIYTYMYPKEKLDVYPCKYMLLQAWLHTY